MEKIPDYKLFRPTKVNMLREYPELSEYKEFAGLSNDDMNFVWHVANPTSEISSIPDLRERRKAAYTAVWGKDFTDRLPYIDGNYSEKVGSAIERMKSFSPSARMRAKLMLEKTISDFEEVIHKSMVSDPDEIKKQAEVRVKIIGMMPDLVKQLERGYGISIEVEEEDDTQRKPSYWDKVMDYSDANR